MQEESLLRNPHPFLYCANAFQSKLAFNSAPSADPMGAERRRTNRYPFDAAAEVSDDQSGGTLSLRLTELSLNGCYLQTEAPFPVGTVLSLKVFADGNFVEARATVAYSQPKMGMGVAFREVKPYYVAVIKKWLLAAMLAKQKPQI
jgi:PilZ domain